LRNRRSTSEDKEDLDSKVVNKLVELRIYLEKGVRPLEGRLKYQIDKVLRAADDAARANAPKTNRTTKKSSAIGSSGGDNSEGSEDDSDAKSTNGVVLKASEIDDLQYRPNPSSLLRPSNGPIESETKRSSDGLYKPPRITATAMPTTRPRKKEARKPNKSATLDEFISTEASTAPLVEPSIGSTIISGGRRSKSEKEKKDEAERREYEEKNYARLPKESKKERAKKGGRKEAGYGGEEWRELGEGIDRIERLTKRKGGEGRGVLEKSRKRPTEDGPRGSGGVEAGQWFQKRLKDLDGGRRDRGRK
jgi:U3 small nucleolar ribonucleoprotein protein LCP5